MLMTDVNKRRGQITPHAHSGKRPERALGPHSLKRPSEQIASAHSLGWLQTQRSRVRHSGVLSVNTHTLFWEGDEDWADAPGPWRPPSRTVPGSGWCRHWGAKDAWSNQGRHSGSLT